MSHLKNIISYWRDSLVDAERMGLDGQAFNNPEDYFRVSRFEISTGRINQDITHKIFNKSKTDDNSKLTGENKQTPLIKRQRPAIDTLPESTGDAQKTSSSDSDEKISILLCPIRAVSLTNTVRKDSVAPLWIPAKINRLGELFCDSENAPWLSRKLLEPTELTKHTIGTLTDFNNFLLEYDRPTQNWDDFWLYCLKMLKQVTQMDCDNFTLEGYASQPILDFRFAILD